MSSFFLKPNQVNGASKSKHLLRKGKRKRAEVSKKKVSDEISSSDEESTPQDESAPREQSSEDEYETAQEKKVRLAKMYLKEIEREEQKRLEDADVGRDVISERLKEDHLKQIGKYEVKVADQYVAVDEVTIKTLRNRAQKDTVTCICIASDNKSVFSGSKDGVIIKWSIEKAEKIGCIPFVKKNTEKIVGHSSRILSLALSSDNKFLVVGDNSCLIQIWDPSSLEHINTLKGHKKPVTGLCFRKGSYTLYSSSADRSVRVWSLENMAFVETLFGHQSEITSIDVLQSERPVTAGGLDGTMRLWKVAEESQLIFNAHPGHVDTVKCINEQHFISGGDDGKLCVWSAFKKKPICCVLAAHGRNPLNLEPYWISAVASFQHSDLVASGSQDGFIRLWKLGDLYRSIQELFRIPAEGFVNALSFTSDGKYLVAGCGRDHKFGRWACVKAPVNRMLLIPLQKTV